MQTLNPKNKIINTKISTPEDEIMIRKKINLVLSIENEMRGKTIVYYEREINLAYRPTTTPIPISDSLGNDSKSYIMKER